MDKEIIRNKKVYFDYEILEEFVAGMILTGPEIKSIRGGGIHLKSAYVGMSGGRIWLKKANISRYQYDSDAMYDPFRDRELLLKKRELNKIEASLNTEGVTMVPLSVFLQNRFAKVKIAVARGKKAFDKREKIKERSMKRDIQRVLKHY
ncbi:SsrA-binding protein SmpB [Candidatus Peregrinibacteria bacterium]|nr:SsrA-binding protein SmpB [Candidatus Peregrinibacteria bacterium]